MTATELVRRDLPELITELPGPRAKAIVQRDTQALSPSLHETLPARRGNRAWSDCY